MAELVVRERWVSVPRWAPQTGEMFARYQRLSA